MNFAKLLLVVFGIACIAGCAINRSPLHADLDGHSFDDMVRANFTTGMMYDDVRARAAALRLDVTPERPVDRKFLVAMIRPPGHRWVVLHDYSWDQLGFTFDEGLGLASIARTDLSKSSKPVHTIPLRRSVTSLIDAFEPGPTP